MERDVFVGRVQKDNRQIDTRRGGRVTVNPHSTCIGMSGSVFVSVGSKMDEIFMRNVTLPVVR